MKDVPGKVIICDADHLARKSEKRHIIGKKGNSLSEKFLSFYQRFYDQKTSDLA
jgi:hypothetical protein